MKKTIKIFIRKLFLFLLPIIVISLGFIIFAETKLYNYPSTFQLKEKYLRENIDSIEVLVLGSSHNQTAINPGFIKDYYVSNISFAGQNIKIDSCLFYKFVNNLPKLKAVVFEVSYHTLEYDYDPNYFRNSLYLRFYNINLFGRKPKLREYSIYLSKPKLYNKFLNPFTKIINVNKYGFETSSLKNNRFKNLNYDKNIILNDTNNPLINRHKKEDINAYDKNKIILNGMIEYCLKNDISPILIKPPVYTNYYNSYIKPKEERRRFYMDSLKLKLPQLIILDYEQSNVFTIKDFKNEDHLNPKGAVKFSKLLNLELNKLSKLQLE